MAEGERVEFDEVVNPDTAVTEGTAEKPVETPEKEAVVKPGENFYSGIAEKL
jgi:hypothetical protein